MGWVGQLAGFQNAAAIVAGTRDGPHRDRNVRLCAGTARLAWLRSSRSIPPARRQTDCLAAADIDKFALGLMMGFLPCGLIYAALMKAIGTASPFEGALTMLAFALGTSVALVVVGLGSSAATVKLARWGTTVSAITVLIMGLVLIGRGAFAGSMTHHHMMHSM